MSHEYLLSMDNFLQYNELLSFTCMYIQQFISNYIKILEKYISFHIMKYILLLSEIKMKYIGIILLLVFIGCPTFNRKISNQNLVGKWQLIGEYCNEEGNECSPPNQPIIIEFTDDGFFIINRNRRNRASYSIVRNKIIIEKDRKDQKVIIHFIDSNTILSIEPDIISKFSRIKG